MFHEKYLDEHVKRETTQPIQSDQKLALLGFQLEGLTSELQSLRLHHDQAVNATFTARNQGESTLICQFCGMINHTALTCRKITRIRSGTNNAQYRPNIDNQVRNNARFNCSYCGRPSHRAFECMTKQRDLEANSRYQSHRKTSQYRPAQGQTTQNTYNRRQGNHTGSRY